MCTSSFARAGEAQELLGAHADRRARRARAHAGRAAGEVLAHVALHRFLRHRPSSSSLGSMPGLRRRCRAAATTSRLGRCALRVHGRHLDHAVRAVALAVAAADAGVVDEHLAVRPRGGSRRAGNPSCSADARSGGTRSARGSARRSGPASRSRREVPSCVSAQAFSQLSQRTHSDLVDQQHVGRLADALLHAGSEMMLPGSGCASIAALARSAVEEARLHLARASAGLRASTLLEARAVEDDAPRWPPPRAPSPCAATSTSSAISPT